MTHRSTPDDIRQLARSLFRLARAGAYVEPAAAEAACLYQVLSPRNDFAAPTALLPAPAIAEARALGWLTPLGPEGRLALSRQGRHAVKREISAANRTDAAPTAGRGTDRGSPRPRQSRASRTDAKVSATDAGAGVTRGLQRIEGPLLWLRNRKDRSGRPLITHEQYEAGMRFAGDYAKGLLQARVTASWSVTAPCLRTGTAGGGVDISDAALAARNRFYAAMAAVGPEMGQLLVDVCCHDIGLEAAERARGWPVRSGKVVLDMGLTALARHFGFEAPPAAGGAPVQPRSARARRWADPAFTPTLSRWTRAQVPAASRDAPATATP